jgi:hypothetical protein
MNSPKKSPLKINMNEDALYHLMLQADSKTLSELCSMNEISQHFCNSIGFWKEKYKSLPVSVAIPKTLNKKLTLYDNVIFYYNLAIDIHDFIISQGTPNNFCSFSITEFGKSNVGELKKFDTNIYQAMITQLNEQVKSSNHINSIDFISDGTKIDLVISPLVGRRYKHVNFPTDRHSSITILTNLFLKYPQLDAQFSLYGYDEGYNAIGVKKISLLVNNFLKSGKKVKWGKPI